METIETWNNINTILDRESIKENIKSILFDFKTKSSGFKLPFFVGCHSFATSGLLTNKLLVLLTFMF